jgi:hypothetical protein
VQIGSSCAKLELNFCTSVGKFAFDIENLFMKYHFNAFLAAFCLAVLLANCANPPDYSDAPSIEFVSVSKTTMFQTRFGQDTVGLTFSFTDGDGDISFSDTTSNVFIVDARDNFSKPSYRIPRIDEQGVGNGISGTITISVPTTCCIYPPNTAPPCDTSSFAPEIVDTLTYRIQIMDRARNKSNEITTAPIYLICKRS